MADKKATREAYGQALADLGAEFDFLVLDADLAASTKTAMFKKKFPERFFDCGISEGNMMSVRLELPRRVSLFSRPPLRCLLRDVPLSRSETASDTPTST